MKDLFFMKNFKKLLMRLSQVSKLLNLKNPVNFLQNILFGSPVIDINKS